MICVVVVVVVCVRYFVSLFFHSSAVTNFKNPYVVMQCTRQPKISIANLYIGNTTNIYILQT